MPKSAEQCEKIRDAMKEKIMNESLRYFALKGLSGTKVSDLAKYIGIGQGTMYRYFSSTEDLFRAITRRIVSENQKSLDALYESPIPSKEKVIALSKSLLERIYNEPGVAETFVLSVHMNMEYGPSNDFTEHYAKEPDLVLAKIIEEGQKDGSFIGGNVNMLADFYWSVVHLIAMKKVYADIKESKPEPAQLIRILIKDSV